MDARLGVLAPEISDAGTGSTIIRVVTGSKAADAQGCSARRRKRSGAELNPELQRQGQVMPNAPRTEIITHSLQVIEQRQPLHADIRLLRRTQCGLLAMEAGDGLGKIEIGGVGE